MIDTDDVQRVTDVRTAGDVLRPAFVLWLVQLGLWGGYWLGSVYLPDRAMAVDVAYLGVGCVSAIVTFVFARRDRDACRVFARPRRGMLELCLLSGVVGSMLLAMWENTIPRDGTEETFWEYTAEWPLALALVSGAAWPAVFEELMYRGVILQRLRAVVSWRLAIAMQAMMFSLAHLDGVYVLPHFVFGCLAGFLRTAAGALWPCMLLHFLWNAWLTLWAYGWL